MADEAPSLLISTAVFFGAFILFGLPVMLLTMALLGEVLAVFGVADAIGTTDTVNAVVFSAVLIAAALIGIQAAYEAASLQLHGIDSLYRGTRLAVLTRHILLSLGVLVTLAGATLIGLSAALEIDSLWLGVPGVLLAIAALGVAFRSTRAFADGYRDQSSSTDSV